MTDRKLRNTAFGIVAALAAASVVSLPATAQDSTAARIRKVSTELELQVTKLARDLLAQRNLERQLMRIYEEQVRNAQLESNEDARQRSLRTAQLMEVEVRQSVEQQLRLKQQLEKVCTAGEKPQGWFGVALQGDVTVLRKADGTDAYRYGTHQRVVTVDPGSPADKAGIRAQDVLVAIGGRDVRVGEVIASEVLRPGAKVPVTIIRDGDRQNIIVSVEQRPETFEMACPWVDNTIAQAFVAATPAPSVRFFTLDSTGQRRVASGRLIRPTPAPQPAGTAAGGFGAAPAPTIVYPTPIVSRMGGTSIVAGAQLVVLNDDLGQAFGVSEGLLVLRVVPGTPAQRSGLKGGDVLLKANDQRLTSPRALERMIELSPDDQVRLTILRLKQQQNVLLKW